MHEILTCQNCLGCRKESEVGSEGRQSTLKKKIAEFYCLGKDTGT